MHRKIVALLLVLCLFLICGGCGNREEEIEETQKEDAPTRLALPDAFPERPDATESVRVDTHPTEPMLYLITAPSEMRGCGFPRVELVNEHWETIGLFRDCTAEYVLYESQRGSYGIAVWGSAHIDDPADCVVYRNDGTVLKALSGFSIWGKKIRFGTLVAVKAEWDYKYGAKHPGGTCGLFDIRTERFRIQPNYYTRIEQMDEKTIYAEKGDRKYYLDYDGNVIGDLGTGDVHVLWREKQTNASTYGEIVSEKGWKFLSVLESVNSVTPDDRFVYCENSAVYGFKDRQGKWVYKESMFFYLDD